MTMRPAFGLWILLWASSALANGVGNGGEYLSLEFTRLGREVFLALTQSPSREILTDDQLKNFDIAIDETRVDAVKGPVIDSYGREVDARVVFDKLYEETVIEINRMTWPNFITIRGRSHRLVFHEYLRVLGIDDDNYSISSRLESEPFLTFLQAQAPVLSGTKLFEQLQRYYPAATNPNWGNLVDGSGVFKGRCFSSGNDIGLASQASFYTRNNGPILEPSKMINFFYGNGPGTGKVGVLSEVNSAMNAAICDRGMVCSKMVSIRAYGSTLIAYLRSNESFDSWGMYCYGIKTPK